MRARGRRPSALARSSLIHSTAAAPSLIWTMLPAVWMPSGITGFERGQLLGGGLAQAVVAGDDVVVVPSASATSTGMISRSKRPSSVARIAFCCEMRPRKSTSFAGDAAALGDALGGAELIGHVDAKSAGFERAVDERGRRHPWHVGAEPHLAHVLDTAGEADVDGAGVIRLAIMWLACWRRAALAVDGGGGHLVRQPGRQPRGARDVAGLLAGLGDAAADDLTDGRRIDAGPLQHADLRVRRAGASRAGRRRRRCACRSRCDRPRRSLGCSCVPPNRDRPTVDARPGRFTSRRVSGADSSRFAFCVECVPASGTEMPQIGGFRGG